MAERRDQSRPVPPVRPATLATQVGDRVRSWLRDGTLHRGELYSVQQIADRLDVSRSPAREGLLSLSEMGLIEFTRNRGFRVVVPGARDVAEIFALRLALEPAAARLAAMHRDPSTVTELGRLIAQMDDAASDGADARFAGLDQQLHATVMRAAGNARATAVVGQLRDVTRALGPTTAGRSRSLAEILAEHRPFVDAIGSGGAARAQMAMRRHLISTGRLLIQQCRDDGDEHAWATWELLVDEDA